MAATWPAHLAHLALKPPGPPGIQPTWRTVFAGFETIFAQSTWPFAPFEAHLARSPPGPEQFLKGWRANHHGWPETQEILCHLARSPPRPPGAAPTWRPPGAHPAHIPPGHLATWPTWRRAHLARLSATWRKPHLALHLALNPIWPTWQPGNLAQLATWPSIQLFWSYPGPWAVQALTRTSKA